ncbi:hypothetical protein BH20ACI4_BH20ACI4_10200 [soil metagenome]
MKDNDTKKILKHLKESLKSFVPTKPCIYAIGVTNALEFPLISTKVRKKPNDIIYIGITKKNQTSRIENTHFENGKSKSSTLRRSLGAILREELKLELIPHTNYKFTPDGEEKLTEWMIENLSVSYCEWHGSIEELREIEKEIIKLICPILNLQSNPNNAWNQEITELRNVCRNLAE